MIKLNAFQTNIHAQYDFLRGGAIDRLIKSIKKEDLTNHNALVGNAKSTFTPKKQFLDRHNSVKHRVEEKLYYPNLEITNSECACAVSINITSTLTSTKAFILAIVSDETPIAAATNSLPYLSEAALG